MADTYINIINNQFIFYSFLFSFSLQRNPRLVIFPEGHRNPNRSLLPFRYLLLTLYPYTYFFQDLVPLELRLNANFPFSCAHVKVVRTLCERKRFSFINLHLGFVKTALIFGKMITRIRDPIY